ncbi:hypothetical protein [Actinoalloteichus spitiensis]|uniref:hypothetical protein n=1 Tax=Actinoalloteichus spitiensis TaxID=252394 RepID=UPI00036E0B87|nr:hypothetical protein [Actinoalloteichus spitiensis]
MTTPAPRAGVSSAVRAGFAPAVAGDPVTALPPDVVMPGRELARLVVWWPEQYRPVRLGVEAGRLGVVLRPEHAPAEPVGLPGVQARRVAGALLVPDADAVATVITAGPGVVASLMVTTLSRLGGKVLTLTSAGAPPLTWVLPVLWRPPQPQGPALTHPQQAGELIGRAASAAETLT